KRAEAAEKTAERSDKTANNAINAIVQSAKPPSAIFQAPQITSGISPKAEAEGWKLPPWLGEFIVPRSVLPFVLLFLGFGIGWVLKAREAEAEIRARIENTKQIQEGTRVLAEMAKTQAEQVK